MAICARKNIASRVSKVENIEDEDQDVVWAEVTQSKNKKFYLACYYGKQEADKRTTIEKEYQQLDTQLGTMIRKGEIIIAADFNAKLEINEDNYKQKQSKNGELLQKLINKYNLQKISLNSTTGKWTRIPRNKNEKESIIDYILMTPGIAKQVTEVRVDEQGIYRLQGKTKTDHNTIIVEINLNIKPEIKKVKKWNLNNKEGWAKYNTEFKRNHDKNKPKNQQEMQNLIINTLKNTIGETTVTIGKKSPKETEEIKELQETKQEKYKQLEEALQNNREEVPTKLQEYYEAQTKLREEKENQQKTEAKNRLSKFKQQNGTKSVYFWRMKAEAEREIEAEYDTITEEGTLLQTPEETKNYIADYYENLYQARPSKPGYENSTREIEDEVKEIEKLMETKPKIEEFTTKELNYAIKKLKRKKATGPDNIPNEIFIEADQETKLIYLQNFNNISQTMEIPQQWQVGELKRLDKKKGVKGKCSNERGITLSSNHGKVYERLVNERVLNKINISDDQAGGKKGSSTVDHIVLAKEIILSAKTENKNIDAALLDVTKAYDKAWLTGIMHVLYKQGLTDNHWTIVKKLNENLTARIQTKYGLTRTIRIKDSIRQGGVLSTTSYGTTMDEISKDIKQENLGIPIIENGEKKASLLWVDDVLLMAYENELQEVLEITEKTSSKYHIEYGEPKSNYLPIRNNKKKRKQREYNLGDMPLKETDKYKYLGYKQNSKNNNDDHFKMVKGSAEAAFQHMMSLTGDSNFSQIEMITIWEIMDTCILPIITYSGEAWEASNKNYKEANQIYEALIRRILRTPPGTPREALYWETGLTEPETAIKKNRINMEARIRQGKNETMKTILNSTYENSWTNQNKKIKEEFQITQEDMKQKRSIIKSRVKLKSKDYFSRKTKETAKEKSKMKFYNDNKQANDKTPKRPRYMEELTRNQASTIFKARTRMLKVKSNYKNGNTNLLCRLCKKEEETQKHALEDCEEINKHLNQVTTEMIFDENHEKLRETSKTIDKRIELLETTKVPCYKESKKKSKQQEETNNNDNNQQNTIQQTITQQETTRHNTNIQQQN